MNIIEWMPTIWFITFTLGGLLGFAWWWLFDTTSGEIWRLKRRARKLIHRLNWYMDGSNCGRAMLREIHTEFRMMEDELESIMERCREIDPKAPGKMPPPGTYP